MANLQAGDYGITIKTLLKEKNSTTGLLGAKDVSAASAIKFLLTDPSGTVRILDADFTTDGSDGYVEYVLADGDIDVPGHYQAQFRLTISGKPHTSSPFHFQVDPALDTVVDP